MSEITGPLTPEQQDEKYMHLLPAIVDEFQKGYDKSLVYHIWQHAENTHAKTNEYRTELRNLGILGVPGVFMTAIDSFGHDYGFETFARQKKSNHNPYKFAEEHAMEEGGKILLRRGVDKFTVAQFRNNVYGTKLGVRCDTIGQFTLCAGDLANTGDDYDAVMKPDTEKLRLEKENLEGITVDPTAFAINSLSVVSGYHFVNLWVPRFLADSPLIRAMYDRQTSNLRTMAVDIANSIGAVDEEAVNDFMQKIGGAVSQLCSIRK